MSFRMPIPELAQAADDLNEAVSAIIFHGVVSLPAITSEMK